MFKQLLKRYNIRPSKRLGQNFLANDSVLEKIIKAAELSQEDTVLEIGSGLGNMTIELAKKAKMVIAVEKDEKLCNALKEIIAAEKIKNIEIIHNDILKLKPESRFLHDRDKTLTRDKNKRDERDKNKEHNATYNKVVANLPYYISSPVIRMFLEAETKPELIVLMVQKEVAQRICAKPPHMSMLAISVQFYAQPKIIDYVSKKYFYPQPKVDSAIIKIKPQQTPEIDTKKFFNLVRAGFSSKRKFLINNLSRELKIENCKLEIAFDQVGLGKKLRAENLTIDDWLKLYGAIKDFIE